MNIPRLIQYAKVIPFLIVKETNCFLRRRLNPKYYEIIRTTIKKFKLPTDQKSNRQPFIEKLFKDRTVTQGPFSGLVYPELTSFGSSLYPKLLGTYEAELHPIFEKIFRREYSTIIDIGCAEGYYTIGLGLHYPNGKIYGFDINQKAREFCQEMAKVNNVASIVQINGEFSLNFLSEITIDGQGFILSDCEGAEKYIFDNTSPNWKYLVQNFDLLIEVHEFIIPGIKKQLSDIFYTTHTIRSIFSIRDELRPLYFANPLLSNLSQKKKIALLSESRPTKMEWIYLERSIISNA